MAAITIRNLSDETHRALKSRAAASGRSTEAEVRSILDAAVTPRDPARLGTLLADIGHGLGGIELEIARDQTSSKPINLS